MATTLLVAMGLARILIGLVPFVATTHALRALAVPVSHDNPTGRLMARLFGMRDIGLGVLVFWATTLPEALGFVLLFNAATDFGDAGSALVPLVKRQGIDRAAGFTTALAGSAGLLWLAVWWWTRS